MRSEATRTKKYQLTVANTVSAARPPPARVDRHGPAELGRSARKSDLFPEFPGSSLCRSLSWRDSSARGHPALSRPRTWKLVAEEKHAIIWTHNDDPSGITLDRLVHDPPA
jgi:hypothetical protein